MAPRQLLELPLDEDGSATTNPEFVFRGEDGIVRREVRRRDGRGVETVLGLGSEGGDLRALADKAFLSTRSRPDWSLGDRALRVADLFSGCGAMSLGIAEACRAVGLAFEPVLACDLNETALGVYARNFGIDRPPARDLSQLSSLIEGSSTPFEIGLQKSVEAVDLVVAGPPCQGHSNLNNYTRRNDPKNGLYLKVARFARLFAPRHIVIENVPAVVRDHGAVVHRTTEALEQLGYRVASGVVDMLRIGVAQTRKRHVLIASSAEVPTRVPTIAEVVRRFEVETRDVRWAIGDLLDEEVNGDLFRGAPNMTDVTRRRIDLLFDENRHELPDDHRPDCHRTRAHTYGSVYGRMHWDRPAPTITSGFSTMGQGRFVHPERRRTLTAHEAARIQFIPDFFDFSSVVHRNHMCEIIGNAVPPKLSYVMGLELLR